MGDCTDLSVLLKSARTKLLEHFEGLSEMEINFTFNLPLEALLGFRMGFQSVP